MVPYGVIALAGEVSGIGIDADWQAHQRLCHSRQKVLPRPLGLAVTGAEHRCRVGGN